MAFIPLHDGNPLRYIRRPFVSWSLILANVVIFFVFQGGGLEEADRSSVVSFGLIPALFTNVVDRPAEFLQVPDWATLVTYSFLHGDFWHLAGNMVFLWVFADNIEDFLGHLRFLLFYVLCAVASGLAYVLSDPGSYSPVVGASGAIAGIVAAYFMLFPYAKVWILVFARIPLRLNALWVLGFWILFQIYSVIGSAGGRDGENDIAWWTHIGGLIAGAVLIPVMRRPGVRLFARPPPPPAIPPPVPAPLAPEPPRTVDGPWDRR